MTCTETYFDQLSVGLQTVEFFHSTGFKRRAAVAANRSITASGDGVMSRALAVAKEPQVVSLPSWHG
jgi:hypothetical protein